MTVQHSLLSAPENVAASWRAHIPGLDVSPHISRPRLVQQILASTGRWVSVLGLPGSGRSTVLFQLATHLEHIGSPYVASFSAAQSLDLVGVLAAGVPEGSAVLVDDFDLATDPDRLRDALCGFLAVDPSGRVITTSIDDLSCDRLERHSETLKLDFVAGAHLLFTHEEIRSLFLATCAEHNIVLVDEQSIEASVRRIEESSMRSPFSVRIALQQEIRSLPDPPSVVRGSALAAAASAVQSKLLETIPQRRLRDGLLGKLAILELMPRFTQRHIGKLFPAISAAEGHEILGLPHLDSEHSINEIDVAWVAAYWPALIEKRRLHREQRIKLAEQLLALDEPGAAFDQFVLAQDYLRAEMLLRSQFLTVFETTAPETVAALASTARKHYKSYPLLYTFHALVMPYTVQAQLSECAQMLRGFVSQLNETDRHLTNAVRAVVHDRLQDTQAARETAWGVIEAVQAQIDEEDSSEINSSPAEASVIAILALLSCGGFPRRELLLPKSESGDYLEHRRSLAFSAINAALYEQFPNEESAGALSDAYRSLVYPPSRCLTDIAVFQEYDEQFRRILASWKDAEETDVRVIERPEDIFALSDLEDSSPSILRDVATLYKRLTSTTAAPPASKEAFQTIPLPFRHVVEWQAALYQGDTLGAITAIDQIDDGWGERLIAIRVVHRCSAMLYQGNTEGVQLMLDRSDAVSEALLAQTITLMPAAIGQALAALSPRLARIFNAASTVGLLGTGALREKSVYTPSLSPAELKVLRHLADGLNTTQIADRLHLSAETVRTHVKRMASKLGVRGQAAILQRARKLSLLS
ncbi:hypothetical protein EG850_12955 [Gulosibacter macacae]|uniref:HTH luxR-type domain-containing protein n=1 Tax=Gulosibacter macacae TaxID=2488791 RepID=A0A3P3VS02_9MICO|nr:hypothetical protein EG850_12955 [Gulosibacter macacae]